VQELFDRFPAIETVNLEPGSVTVRVGEADAWETLLLPVFDTILAAFIPARTAVGDRQLERAQSEIGRLDPTDSRDIAKILDAVTSPDAAMRRVAVARLEKAETLVAQRPWLSALRDQSRPVRRAAARAMAFADAPPPRALCELALEDKDPCVRYYALRGIVRLPLNQSEPAVDKRRRDEDVRVRMAANSAVQGQTPP
jgi:HEAT repeat protein